MEKRENEVNKSLLEEMPQLNKDGVSYDYINEYAWFLPEFYLQFKEKFKEMLESIEKRKNGKIVLKYEERFPPNRFKDVITEKNREKIEVLNKLGGEVNNLYKEGKLTPKEFAKYQSQVAKIIYNSET